MNDRELLEAAAKAAGLHVGYINDSAELVVLNGGGPRIIWNPLTDDGDAMRLVAKLHFAISYHLGDWDGWMEVHPIGGTRGVARQLPQDEKKRMAAIRRSIVHAAAALVEDQS